MAAIARERAVRDKIPNLPGQLLSAGDSIRPVNNKTRTVVIGRERLRQILARNHVTFQRTKTLGARWLWRGRGALRRWLDRGQGSRSVDIAAAAGGRRCGRARDLESGFSRSEGR